jgi:hypothetical protein
MWSVNKWFLIPEGCWTEFHRPSEAEMPAVSEDDFFLNSFRTTRPIRRAPGVNLSTETPLSLSESLVETVLMFSKSISPDLARKLRELMALQRGWDEDDAEPIRTMALLSAVGMLSHLYQADPEFVLPFISPTFDGHLLLDWTNDERTLEVQTGSDGLSLVGTLLGNGQRKYFDASINLEGGELLPFYRWFRGELRVWPTV